MRIILMVLLALTGLWDGFTTLWGTSVILGDSSIHYFVSTLMALVTLGLLFSTHEIIETDVASFLGLLLRALWIMGVSYDLFTSYMGNEEFLIGGIANAQQFVVLIGITVVVSGSPIVFSMLRDQL